jgi:hypothetical protein
MSQGPRPRVSFILPINPDRLRSFFTRSQAGRDRKRFLGRPHILLHSHLNSDCRGRKMYQSCRPRVFFILPKPRLTQTRQAVLRSYLNPGWQRQEKVPRLSTHSPPFSPQPRLQRQENGPRLPSLNVLHSTY